MGVILEYSEEQQVFHNNIGDKEESTNGYRVLGEISLDDSFKFVEYVKNNLKLGKYIVTYNEIKELFDSIF